MELLKANFLLTTTQLVLGSNTDLASYLFDRDTSYQYVTSGFAGNTTTTIRVNFLETTSVSRIALVEHNLKAFRMYYDGATANAFSFLSGDTSTSVYTTNSETSKYFNFTPVNCTSVSFDLSDTIVANNEKAIGYMVISAVQHAFDRVAPAKGYKPKIDSIDVVHKLSDGGTRVQKISEKHMVDLNYQHVSVTEKRALKEVWRFAGEMIFAPFGTTTGWDGVIFPCIWEGPFDFEEFSDNAVDAGFTGKINLLETPE